MTLTIFTYQSIDSKPNLALHCLSFSFLDFNQCGYQPSSYANFSQLGDEDTGFRIFWSEIDG